MGANVWRRMPQREVCRWRSWPVLPPTRSSRPLSCWGSGLRPQDIVKSLVVRAHDGSYPFALIPGDRQISWPRLRAAVGVNKLSMPSPELALEATGYERGTITPIGARGGWPVYADSSIVGRRIAMGPERTATRPSSRPTP